MILFTNALHFLFHLMLVQTRMYGTGTEYKEQIYSFTNENYTNNMLEKHNFLDIPYTYNISFYFLIFHSTFIRFYVRYLRNSLRNKSFFPYITFT